MKNAVVVLAMTDSKTIIYVSASARRGALRDPFVVNFSFELTPSSVAELSYFPAASSRRTRGTIADSERDQDGFMKTGQAPKTGQATGAWRRIENMWKQFTTDAGRSHKARCASFFRSRELMIVRPAADSWLCPRESVSLIAACAL